MKPPGSGGELNMSSAITLLWRPIFRIGKNESIFDFLSILSIKCGNWFYWADRAERADRAESKESPVFMHI
jgi:hypothetical protein